MHNRYIIPDIHGCYQTLRHMVSRILQPDKHDRLIFLGDFINKGPDSKKVLDFVMDLIESGFRVEAVMGNHDKLLLDLCEERIGQQQFEEKGGDQTLNSFGVSSCRDIPQKYLKFIEGLAPYLIVGDYVIVHAGINFEAEDPWKDVDSMMTIRDYRVSQDQTKYRQVIHGHQASPLGEVLSKVLDNHATTINLDNGCVYTWREGMGNLFVLNLKDKSFHIQPGLDRN